MKSLYQRLIEYEKEGYYPMHMPGHKRNIEIMTVENTYGTDITEIDGFDNLHDSSSIIKEAMERAGSMYHSMHTHFLVNGSTVGILAGIAACTQKGDKVLIARNSHKSVYNAIFLNELKPTYVYPQIVEEYSLYGGILPQDIEIMLIKNPDIKMVVITSPTYEGIVSDVESIVNICHEYRIPCMVDEAHGAHFRFSKDGPVCSVEKGADIVIHSLHKTLPSLTQTALIHINGTLVDYSRIKDYLSIYQSSSPSYILMASIDRCMELIDTYGEKLFHDYYASLSGFYERMKKLKRIRIYNFYEDVINSKEASEGIYAFDRSKVVISVKNTSMSGKVLYDVLLNKYMIQAEMVSRDYVLAMTSICDTQEGFLRLEDALYEIDKEICDIPNINVQKRRIHVITTLTPGEAYNKESEYIPLQESKGRISKDYIYLYPPGIPYLVPGEVITEEFIESIAEYKKLGLMIKGFKDSNSEYINIVK